MIQNFEEFLNESLKKEFIELSTIDLQKYNVWTPNDDLSTNDVHNIALKFYDKYPSDHNDCGTILGFSVKCQYNFKPMALFTIFFKDADIKQRIDVVKEIVNFLTETIYSVAGNDIDIEKMLKSI